jgi:haloacetate dehalogenase
MTTKRAPQSTVRARRLSTFENGLMNPADKALFEHFDSHRVAVGGVDYHLLTGGEKTRHLPPLLMLHGHPQTHAMWHKVAPQLAERFHLVLPDLRGYGDTAKPAADAEHANYSKRVMAADLVQLMRQLGHTQFAVLAHDRGARVAHRMLLDHPDAVSRAMLLDIAPTLAMYEGTGNAFARAYWHWFFLIQPAPLPETLLSHDPAFYVRSVMGGRIGGLAHFDPRALAEYERCAALPGAVAAICEDYRASATIDLDHDRQSIAAGNRVRCPLRVLWGERGVVHANFDVLRLWQAVADRVDGRPLPSGHYIAEEAPALLVEEALVFFTI